MTSSTKLTCAKNVFQGIKKRQGEEAWMDDVIERRKGSPRSKVEKLRAFDIWRMKERLPSFPHRLFFLSLA